MKKMWITETIKIGPKREKKHTQTTNIIVSSKHRAIALLNALFIMNVRHLSIFYPFIHIHTQNSI